MVKLTKIYTKTGDEGTTGLATGQRVPKDDLRVEAYGTVDEANAAIGIAVVACDLEKLHGNTMAAELARVLRHIQNDLFDLGADLATPVAKDEKPSAALRIVAHQTLHIEQTIDHYNERLQPLNSFVLPGGTPVGSALHLARTIVRRAERIAVSLKTARPEEVSAEAIRYINRLSDLLFVLGRVANDDGKSDVLWVPGAGRK
jgi:cob(I)alamin adenosyltransferase